MQDSSKDQEQYREAVSYLLGELAGKSAEEFERRYLAEQETFEFLEAVEEDLIEDYLRGGLSADERSLFERRYMARPENRQKIEFAKELLHCASLKDTGPGLASLSSPDSALAERPVLGAYAKPLAMAAAAALILTMGATIWLAISVKRLNTRLAAADQERAQLEARAEELRSRLETEQGNNKALADELQQVQEQLRALQRREPAASVLSLFLPLDLTRGGGPGHEARLTAGVTSLDLQLDIKDVDFELYRATVRQLSDGVIWSGNNLKPARGSSGRVLKIKLGATTLKPGAYVITLYGITDSGEAKYAGEYSLTVVRE